MTAGPDPSRRAADDRERCSALAGAVKAFVARDDQAAARDRFDELVGLLQRRAVRLAFRYVHDVADADEAVQDAFIKAYVHIDTYRDELPFDVWFTRILANGCLDRLKARQRLRRWLTEAGATVTGDWLDWRPASGPTPEDMALAGERHRQLTAAVATLAERQRHVFALSHFDGRTAREVSAITGMNEATVRVHLFRAVRKLKRLLQPPDGTNSTASGQAGRASGAAERRKSGAARR
jgi:RNA polymerase sigma-70 factor, ECF subfamily